MEVSTIVGIVQESIVPILIYVVFLTYAIARGRRALTKLVLSLYFALLISLKFPYYDALYSLVSDSFISDAIVSIVVFGIFTIINMILFDRLLADMDDERSLSGMSKKALLALLGTILVMAFSYHVLPVTSIIEIESPLSVIFAPAEYFFWWLIIPLVGLFLLF